MQAVVAPAHPPPPVWPAGPAVPRAANASCAVLVGVFQTGAESAARREAPATHPPGLVRGLLSLRVESQRFAFKARPDLTADNLSLSSKARLTNKKS